MRDEAARQCPRWARCSVNNCPLTVEYPNWSIAEGDAEKKCPQAKSRRVAIGSQYQELKYGGMTPREFAVAKRLENMTDEERQSMSERLKKHRFPRNKNRGA